MKLAIEKLPFRIPGKIRFNPSWRGTYVGAWMPRAKFMAFFLKDLAGQCEALAAGVER